jgi:hypothetical protein
MTRSPSHLLAVLTPIATYDLNIDIYNKDFWPKAPNVLTEAIKTQKNSKGRGDFLKQV